MPALWAPGAATHVFYLYFGEGMGVLWLIPFVFKIRYKLEIKCPDQEGRKGSEEGVPENLSVPLEGDRDFGELCGSHQGNNINVRLIRLKLIYCLNIFSIYSATQFIFEKKDNL